MQKIRIESERITNIGDYERLISKARADMVWLKGSLERKDYEVASHLAGQIDLTLHQMEAHEFQIERRIITVHDHDESQ